MNSRASWNMSSLVCSVDERCVVMLIVWKIAAEMLRTMTNTIINSIKEKPDVFLWPLILLAPQHNAQCHRQRKVLIPFPMPLQLGAHSDQIRLRASHSHHMQTHLIGA